MPESAITSLCLFMPSHFEDLLVIMQAATKLLGFGPQEGEAREEMKALASEFQILPLRLCSWVHAGAKHEKIHKQCG